MTIPIMSQPPHGQHAVSYVPHVGWLSHQKGEELITLLHRGCFEAAEQAFFWLYLRPGDCFIDCGAHIGLYSVIANNAAKGNIELVSVEADPKTFLYLKENIEHARLEAVTLVNAAVWNRSGEIGYVDAGAGKAAYSHIAFDDSFSTLEHVRAITLDEIVAAVSAPQVNLMKIDVEGAEPEVLSGGARVISEQLCPLIMIEFTEENLTRRGVTSIQLAKQLENFGYELCEFSTESLELLPFHVEGPVWHKNLFACIDRLAVSARLSSTNSENRQVAQDILARARDCTLYKELEELQKYKSLASANAETREWAERAEQTNAQLREWAERNEQTSAQLREWAEKAQEQVAREQENTRQMRQWAERAEQTNAQLREWAERNEQTSAQLREWAEKAQEQVAREQENTRQMRQWAERNEQILVEEQERLALLEKEIAPLRSFVDRFSWLYRAYLRLRRPRQK